MRNRTSDQPGSKVLEMKRNLLALKPKLSKDLAENGKPKDITSVADHPPVLV